MVNQHKGKRAQITNTRDKRVHLTTDTKALLVSRLIILITHRAANNPTYFRPLNFAHSKLLLTRQSYQGFCAFQVLSKVKSVVLNFKVANCKTIPMKVFLFIFTKWRK